MAKLRLSRLRDIGWSLWDPIGLNPSGGNWEDLPNADEYDGYLIKVANMIRNGEPYEKTVGYLIAMEQERMGLGAASGIKERAEAVVAAIGADAQLWAEP